MSGAGKAFIAIGVILISFALLFFRGSFGTTPDESILAGIILSSIGVVFAAAGSFLLAMVRKKAYLLSEGIDGEATIIQWWVLTRNEGAVSYVENCEFELEVMDQRHPPYRVTHRQPTPIGIVQQLGEGVVLPVKIHPNKPNQLLLDWDRVEAESEAEDDEKTLKDKLKELEDAYSEKLIDTNEYQKKRAEILKKL